MVNLKLMLGFRPCIWQTDGVVMHQYYIIFQKILLIGTISLLSSLTFAQEKSLSILAAHFPPYEFETPVDGLRGFDIEVVEAAYQRVGINIKYEFLPWPRAVELTYSGKAFALLSCAWNKKRSQHLYFSNEISSTTYGYFFRKDEQIPTFTSLTELKDMKVVAVRGYSTQMKLKDLSIEHIAARNNKIALNLLHNGRVDFFYGSVEANLYIAKQMGISQYLGVNTLEAPIPYHLCISQKWPNSKYLLDQFNKGLSEIKNDGTFTAIHSKYR
jgi:polar amino acid transport system substrate-binding protein